MFRSSLLQERRNLSEFFSIKQLNNVNLLSACQYIDLGVRCVYFATKFMVKKFKNKIKMRLLRSLHLALMAMFYLMSSYLMSRGYRQNIEAVEEPASTSEDK